MDKKNEDKEIIKNIIIRSVKKYRLKDPFYVNVIIESDIISIYIKGILSKIGEVLFYKKEIELIKKVWRNIKDVFIKEIINEIDLEVGYSCALISEVSDFENDSRTIILRRQRLD